MKRPVARLGLVLASVFVVGFGAGFAFRAVTMQLAGDRESPSARPRGRGPLLAEGPHADGASSRPAARPGARRLEGGGADGGADDRRSGKDSLRPDRFEENPFRGLPREEIEARLLDALDRRDHDGVDRAVAALVEMDGGSGERLAGLLGTIVDPRAAEDLARQLVRRGGRAAVETVARLAGDAAIELGLRRALLHALGEIPDEHREAGSLILKDLLLSGLPVELQFPAAHSYGRVLGKEAISGILALVGSAGAGRQPLLGALRDFARREDLPLLVDFLASTIGREEQESLLRAIGGAAGAEGGSVLLDILESPPAGVSREAVGNALDEFARKGDLPRLWENLRADDDRATQAALARVLARVGGIDEVRKLVEIAGDPASGLSWDSLGRALEGSGSREIAPLIEDVLRASRTWEGVHPLARELVRISGREGLERLLSLVGEDPAGGGEAKRGEGGQGAAEERRRAIVQTIEDLGDASMVGPLRDLLAVERDHGVAFHIAKAILRLDPEAGPSTLAERIAELPEGDGRAALATLLEREGTADLIPTLTRALGREEHGRAQWHLARTIASLGPEGVGAIGDLLAHDPSPQRRAEILRGLESTSAEGIAPIARELLKDPAPDVRRSAAKVLARSGDPSARDDLLGALSSEADGGVRDLLGELLREKEHR